MKRYNVPRVCFINKMDRYVERSVFIIVADLQKADMSSYIFRSELVPTPSE